MSRRVLVEEMGYGLPHVSMAVDVGTLGYLSRLR